MVEKKGVVGRGGPLGGGGLDIESPAETEAGCMESGVDGGEVPGRVMHNEAVTVPSVMKY